MSVIKRIKHCWYGRSASGKTGRLPEFLTAMREIEGNPHARARLYSVEDVETLDHRIASKDIEYVKVDIFDSPFSTLNRVSQGYWPEDPEDPKSKWLPPTKDTWKDIRVIFYEGLHSFAEYVMGMYAKGGLAELAGRGIRTGPGSRPGEDTVQFDDGGGIKVGGNSRSHYNVGQNAIHAAVKWSHRLPVHSVWTAHEAKTKEDKTGRAVVGPEIIGDAKTPHVPQWFGCTWHFATITGTGNKGTEYRIYLKDHYDPEAPTLGCISQVRLPVEVMDEPEIQKLLSNLPTFIPNKAGVLKDAIIATAEIQRVALEIIERRN